MVVCKCLAKQRDNQGNIIRYALQDAYGNICRCSPDELKSNISHGVVEVINLKLTSDNRLIDNPKGENLVIQEVERITVGDNEIPMRTFMAGQGKRPEPLHGWMAEDNTEYHESIYGVLGGVLEVSRLSWRVQLNPDRSERIGVWVNEGYSISGATIDKFCEKLLDTWDKAQEKAAANPDDTWSYESFADVNVRYNYAGLTVWPTHSQLHFKSRAEIESFIHKIIKCKTRVDEIREIKGWRAKKTPVMKPDGTVETKGNWFNKWFGKR